MAVRRPWIRRIVGRALLAAIVGGLGGGSAEAGHAPEQGEVKQPPRKNPLAKLAEPWPDAEKLAQRRAEAEKLSLFQDEAPLAIRLTADFSAINRDRTPNSPKRFPGVLQAEGAAGRALSVPVQLSSRGHARLKYEACSVVPLRLEFAKGDLKGTVFEGQRELKLVTHCQNDRVYEQYVLSEYLTYRLFTAMTPRAFRARLVRATYVESGTSRTPPAHYAILVEHDEDVARRMEGRLFAQKNRLFRVLEQDSLTLLSLLEYMIGNTDYSIVALHNVKLVLDQRGRIYPVGYDFDHSGLVDAHYAVPDPRLRIGSILQRIYRGPCRTFEDLTPFLTAFTDKRAELLALVEGIPDLEPGRRKSAREYLEEFLSLVANPARARRVLADGCVAINGM